MESSIWSQGLFSHSGEMCIRDRSMTEEQLNEQMKMSSLTFNSAKVVVSMLPILIIYPFLQRYFVTGIVMGAVKE